ncbi:MAG TPA: hypothetical protein VFR11_17545, partial [Micromonosporaceae bacterium]|nr:hypothetical protein [Micromonosporaceae bacterium]
IDAPMDELRYLPRAIGRLEPLGDGTTRLLGSTSNPAWYAQQLTAIPASYRILKSPEVRAAAHRLGMRLVRASVSPDP